MIVLAQTGGNGGGRFGDIGVCERVGVGDMRAQDTGVNVGGAAPEVRPPAAGDRMPGLDGLRTVAVTLVLLVHADLVHGGFLGVDLFFVLSGFLITTLMLAELDRTGQLDLVAFWIRRGFRLLPAVIAFLAVGLVVAAVTKPQALGTLARDTVTVIFGVMNHATADSRSSAWDGHLWSLSV